MITSGGLVCYEPKKANDIEKFGVIIIIIIQQINDFCVRPRFSPWISHRIDGVGFSELFLPKFSFIFFHILL